MATTVASAQNSVTVQPRDTLWNIARRTGTDVATLMALNGLSSDQIQPGLVLKLPGVGEGEVQAAAAAAPLAPKTVTVRAGDTLYDIALAHGVSVSDLIAYNDLDGTLIHPGQVLQLEPGDKQLEPLVVTVQKGDSLWSIARAYGATVQALADANGLSLDSVLNPGHRLVVPGQYASAGSQDVGGPAPETIVVERGQTLWTLAAAHNTTVAAIMSANNLTSERIYAGQQLRIVPGSDVTAARAITESVAAAAPARPATTGMTWPLNGAITSRYGYRSLRIAGSNWHGGLDIDGDTGDPIVAAVGGTVKHAGWYGGYGFLVIVEDGDTEYYYAHASEVLVNVGDVVQAGDTIALVGATGNVTGSHLHFEVRVNGETVDPLPLLETAARR